MRAYVGSMFDLDIYVEDKYKRPKDPNSKKIKSFKDKTSLFLEKSKILQNECFIFNRKKI